MRMLTAVVVGVRSLGRGWKRPSDIDELVSLVENEFERVDLLGGVTSVFVGNDEKVPEKRVVGFMVCCRPLIPATLRGLDRVQARRAAQAVASAHKIDYNNYSL